MDWGQVLLAGLVGSLLMVPVVIVRGRTAKPPPDLPNPLAESTAVAATLAAIRSDLAPGGSAGWLSDELGGERAAVEALIDSLRSGLPPDGPFEVNRLVGHAPVRVTGTVVHGAPTVTSVRRLDTPGQG
ncbi:hypothetical protein ACVW00_003236 [Marmoricola sp. URHA0025 HA25]